MFAFVKESQIKCINKLAISYGWKFWCIGFGNFLLDVFNYGEVFLEASSVLKQTCCKQILNKNIFKNTKYQLKILTSYGTIYSWNFQYFWINAWSFRPRADTVPKFSLSDKDQTLIAKKLWKTKSWEKSKTRLLLHSHN